jgi:hypothetical protein
MKLFQGFENIRRCAIVLALEMSELVHQTMPGSGESQCVGIVAVAVT